MTVFSSFAIICWQVVIHCDWRDCSRTRSPPLPKPSGPLDVKSILRRSARSVVKGAANPASNDDNVGEPVSSSDTGAAGAGLVDALAAWKQL